MSERQPPAVHLVPAAVAPLLLVGIAFGAEAGWLTNLLALVLVGALVRRVQPGLARARERGLPGLGVGPGLIITGLGLVAATVLAGAIAAAVGELLVAYPASLWGLAVLGLGALLRGRGRRMGLWGLALALPLAGWMGDGLESEGALARGYAHSGPIAGVHPFQMTAIVVDGYGPFDISVNDFVEPDASRGYGPGDLAVMFERTLHALADVHFADGPARARKAFAEATVELGELPQLYDEVHNPLSIGFVVHSGTHGERSRVEFVCPGQVLDPRPRRPDTVMRDSCPDKYASEGSAGLGLTGRWAGYTEGRGNARQSLAAIVGATRTDDGEGQRVIGLERFAWASGLLLLCVGSARRPQPVRNVAELAGATGLLALWLGFVALVALVREPIVPAIGPAGTIGWGVGVGLAGVTGLAGLGWLSPSEGEDGARVPASDATAWVAAAIGLLALGSAWALASSVSAVDLVRASGPAALVDVLADRASLLTGLDVQHLEGAFAATLLGVLVGAALTVLEPLTQATLRLGLDVDSRPRWPVVLVAAGALGLAWAGPPGRGLVLLGLGSCALMSSAVSIASRHLDRTSTWLDVVVHAGLSTAFVWAMVSTMRVAGASGSGFFMLALSAMLGLTSLVATTMTLRARASA